MYITLSWDKTFMECFLEFTRTQHDFPVENETNLVLIIHKSGNLVDEEVNR